MSGPARIGEEISPALVARVVEAAGLAPGALLAEAAYAARPEIALARCLDLPGEAGELRALEATERVALLALLGGSGHLGRVLLLDEGWAAWLRAAVRGEDAPPTLDLDALVREAPDAAAASRALRRWRQRAFLRIGARDVWGLAPIEETLESLTATADAAIAGATAIARRLVAAEYGPLERAPGVPNRFAALGMGKLGARELNYSSDVDLIFVHESEEHPSGGGPRGSLPPLEYCTRIAERLTKLLAEVTGDGFVFRVDLRLRPDGMNGPLTSSLGATLGYYEAFGQTWERAALAKARPVGGDLDLGEQLLAELAPFIYRRTLDYTMIADLEQMKARVDEQVQSKGREDRHVKLGAGGIREVEFLVQAFALVHGGKDRRLRLRGALAGLRLLAEVGLIEQREAAALSDAYRWLRRVEHALQIDEDRQIHVLPAEEAERAVVARRLGLHLEGDGPVWERRVAHDPLERFAEVHARHTDVVRRAFAELFRGRRAQTVGIDDATARDLIDDLDAPDLPGRLAALGFRDVVAAAEALRVIRDGSGRARAGSRRDALALAPALLTAVRESAAPDRALAQLAEFITRVGARRTFMALLAENPATLRLLIRLFATSEYLTRALLQHPELLDTLVRSDLVVAEKTASRFAAELAEVLGRADDFEERLDLLRRYRNDEALRIGVHDIEGELHYSKVSDQLSALADACLGAAYDLARLERAVRYGAPPAQHLAVVALGKLGSCELNYHSDLDLIFVYGAAPDDAPDPEWARRFEASGLGAHEFFSKLAQLFMLVLQLATREGFAYKIDTRLRPSGRSGPLVTSLEGFESYHQTSSAVWERQALVRARVVCGPPELRARIEQIIERFVYGRGLERAELAEIARLRARMEKELAREDAHTFNLKMGRGGLVDVEFVAQAAALADGHAHPALRQRGTRRLIEAMGAEGLLEREECAALLRAYSFLRGLENRLRIEGEHPIERVRREPAVLVSAARRMGYADPGDEAGEHLLADYDRYREVVREIYTRRVGRFASE